jgi:hypothetical protein
MIIGGGGVRIDRYLKLDKHFEVMDDCRLALALASDPFAPSANRAGGPAFGCPVPISEEARRTVIKALGRRAAAHEGLEDLPSAVVDIQHALMLDHDDEFEAIARYTRMLEKWKERERARDLAAASASRPQSGPMPSSTLEIKAGGLVDETVRSMRRKRCALCRRAKEKGRLLLRGCCCNKVC